MSSTFTQIYIHIVFSVADRDPILSKDWRPELFKYMSGIITHKNHKSIIVNGLSDHVHLLVGYRPAQALADLVRDIKANSSGFINKNRWTHHAFHWQEGYGAFSYSRAELDRVYHYIEDQEAHHQIKSFREEYVELLNEYGIEFDEKYLF
jgi:putative transposase